jgi:uncharacterized protein (DUF362 family)
MEVTVHIEGGHDAGQALARVLQRAGLVESLERAREASGRPPEQFRIAVKPNLMGRPGTDPGLVERLFATLREHGYGDLALVESRTGRDSKRTVASAAREAGYSGEGYRIVDLSDEPVAFDYGSVLGKTTAGRTWLEADYRITFAKAKPESRCFFSGCLANLLGCLPEPDKLSHYAGTRHAFYECCVLVADRLPVDFAVMDASHADELLASRSPLASASPSAGASPFASMSPFAVDWVAGEKMGLDPGLNPVLHEALLRWGRVHLKRRGNVTPWEGWRNVRPATVATLDLLEPLYRGPLRPLGGRRLAEWTVQ